MKGAEAYVDASKDTWRGWKWNAIARGCVNFNDRITPAEKARRLSEKTVLYLVGPEDHDRQKALAKGFANHNLIAVDIVQDRVDAVRDEGGLAIRGSLQQVLMNWPSDWPIDVVDADLCQGMVYEVSELPKCLIMSNAPHAGTIISLNLLRGRDAHTNLLRKSMELNREMWQNNLPQFDVVKHRGANWLSTLLLHFADLEGPRAYQSREENGGANRIQIAIYPEFARDCFQMWQAQPNSYRSKTSGQWFDSVVHRWGAERIAEIPKEQLPKWQRWVSEGMSKSCQIDEGLRGRIAALRAVRTMKMKKGS